MTTFLPIETCPAQPDDGVSYLVYDGTRVGEATLQETYNWDAWDDEDNYEPIGKWAWTHHSTCACCHSYMEPQPQFWAPMPTFSEASLLTVA